MFPTKRQHLFLLILVLLAPLSAEAARRRAAGHPGLPIEAVPQGGYASRASVVQGDLLTLRIASSVQPLNVEIVNLAEPEQVLMTVENLSSHAQVCVDAGGGCDWDATTTFAIPFSWPSGYYAGRFPTAAGERWAPFIVRAAQPGNSSKILVLSSTHTMQALNRFGDSGLDNRVSYQRPYAQHDGLGGYPDDEQLFVDWMTAQGLPFEVASDVDLEDSTLLSRYYLVVIPGRSEYWTEQARANIEQFSRNGGHLAVLTGGTMWHHIHLEDAQQSIVGTIVSWFDYPLYNPETRFFGTSRLYADRTENGAAWTVMVPTHWIFSGTNLVAGSTFGSETLGPVVGGTLFNCDRDGKILGVDASSGTPLNFHILARTPATAGTGTLGIYTNDAGGAVFNAATQRWVHGLRDDAVVSRITRNVIDEFVTGQPVPTDAKPLMMLTEESFNCQQYTLNPLPGWKQFALPKVTQRCAYEGPAGLEFSGANGVVLVRDFTPTALTYKEVGARFYINVDSYHGQTDAPLARVTLRNTVEDHADVPLVVEFDIVGGKAQTRLVRNDSAGNVFRSDWLPLGSGWHLVWLTWRSLGEIVLQLDKIPTLTMQNPGGTDVVGEISFEYPQANPDNDGFVCLDTLAVGTVKPGSVPPNP